MKYYVFQQDAPGVWLLLEPGDPPHVTMKTSEPDRSDPENVVFEIANGMKIGVGPGELIFT